MNKKILTILISMGLIVSLSGCGQPEPTRQIIEPIEVETTIEIPTTTTTTAESTTEETTEMTTTESRISKYDIRPITPVEQSKNTINLQVTPDDESELTAGPKVYRYVYADVYVAYSGSKNLAEGGFLVEGVRCILSREPQEEDGLYAWLIDDNNGVTEAINKFCAEKHISKIDLGGIETAVIQRIYNEFESSYRYEDWYTINYHKLDGDEYTEEC